MRNNNKPEFNGEECEEVFVGRLTKSDSFLDFKEEAYKIGVDAFMNDPDIPNAKELLKTKSRAAIIIAGVYEMRRELKGGGLDIEMERVRQKQVEKDPSNPKSIFAKNLLMDIDEALDDIADGENYDLRFYSAAGDKKIDYAAGIDCWVELVDLKTNKPLFHFSIDVTANTNKLKETKGVRGSKYKIPPLSNFVYFFDRSDVYSDKGKKKIRREIFKGQDYKKLVEEAAYSFVPTIAKVRGDVHQTMIDSGVYSASPDDDWRAFSDSA